jgi:hypothetical protein
VTSCESLPLSIPVLTQVASKDPSNANTEFALQLSVVGTAVKGEGRVRLRLILAQTLGYSG